MSVKLSLLGILALVGAVLAVLRPWSRLDRRLVNEQGVGPAHIPGVPRGEEQILKHAGDGPTSVAGRIAGSVNPA